VEITTQMLSKAVDTLEANPSKADKHTFPGTDLVYSLGSVLHGAVPLLADQDHTVREALPGDETLQPPDDPLGARIIRVVRAYDALAANDSGEPTSTVGDALAELRRDASADCAEVLDTLERVVRQSTYVPAPEPAFS
jgi:hypothetical protein